jgi:transcription elongation GreA/GreB family factor
LEAARRKSQGLVEDLRKTTQQLLESANQAATDEGNRAESLQEEMMEAYNETSRTLEEAMHQREILEKVNTNILHNLVAFGAVVITDTEQFLVAASLGTFADGQHQYVGCPYNRPFTGAMQGKKQGEQFSFRTQQYRIVDLF